MACINNFNVKEFEKELLNAGCCGNYELVIDKKALFEQVYKPKALKEALQEAIKKLKQ